jgi:hypothetical protein
MKIMMNIWAFNDSEWSGEFNSNILPVYAEYNWIKVYNKR